MTMHHVLKWAISAGFLLALGTPVLGQYGYNPFAPVNAQQDPRVRRALRETAVAYAGENSRGFVEKYGDDAVAAISACSQGGARKLVEFYNSGALGKLPRPSDLLKIIALPGNGDDVVMWVVQPEHARQLTDVDNFAAVCLSPLEYVFALKPLEQGAAEARARRLAAQAAVTPAPQPQQPQQQSPQIAVDSRLLGVIGGGIVLLLVIVAWKRRQSGGMAV
jgi:hypothetical protein